MENQKTYISDSAVEALERKRRAKLQELADGLNSRIYIGQDTKEWSHIWDKLAEHRVNKELVYMESVVEKGRLLSKDHIYHKFRYRDHPVSGREFVQIRASKQFEMLHADKLQTKAGQMENQNTQSNGSAVEALERKRQAERQALTEALNSRIFVGQDTKEWSRMWDKLAEHRVNKPLVRAGADPYVAESKFGEGWQYMESVVEKGRLLSKNHIYHNFRHRDHPVTGSRLYVQIPASKQFEMLHADKLQTKAGHDR